MIFFDILLYFIIYSFLGWILESIYRSFCEKKIVNTGFLIGPFCPIYGTGAIIMIVMMGWLKGRIVEIFFISVFVLTAWEYVVGICLEKIFKTKYWDYSNNKFNFQGRICLTNSIFWGLLGVGFINYIHPFIVNIISTINVEVLNVTVYSALTVVIIDTVISIIKVNNIKTAWNKVKELNKQIKEKTKELKENKSINKKSKESTQSIIESLKKKRNRISRKLYRYVYRLKKAFPAFSTKEINEILNKKIVFRKKVSKEKGKK